MACFGKQLSGYKRLPHAGLPKLVRGISGINRRATKCKDAEARAQHQKSKTVGPLHKQVKAKISKQKEVYSWRESVKVGNVLWCHDSLTAPLVQPCVLVSCKHLSGSWFESGLPALSCFIPTPSPHGQCGVEANTSVAHIN